MILMLNIILIFNILLWELSFSGRGCGVQEMHIFKFYKCYHENYWTITFLFKKIVIEPLQKSIESLNKTLQRFKVSTNKELEIHDKEVLKKGGLTKA